MKVRLNGNHVTKFNDPEAVRMNQLRRDVPSAFWLEDWKELNGAAYYDVVAMQTVVELYEE